MQVVEIKTYKFNELSKEAQEKVLNDWRNKPDDIQIDLNLKDTCERFIEDVQKEGYEIAPDDISYSISYCQGDGASFTGKINLSDWLKFNKYNMTDSDYKARLILAKSLSEYQGVDGLNSSDVNIYRLSSHYCHYNTVEIDANDALETAWSTSYDEGEITEARYKVYRNFIKDFDKTLGEDLVTQCQELEKRLYKSYEATQEDSCIIETIEANNYDFTDDGEIF